MPSSQERAPQERETLIFATPEEAARFRENVAERLERAPVQGVTREREVVAEAVAEELNSYGEGAGMVYTQPWHHSEAEHAAVQHLVNLAFAQDLLTALRIARRRPDFPRIVDLFHDALTGQLYEILRQERLNIQRVQGSLLFWAVALALLFVCALVLLILGVLL